MFLVSRIGQPVRNHPDVTSAGRTDIYLDNGRDREEGPVSNRQERLYLQYTFFGGSRTKKSYTYGQQQQRPVRPANGKSAEIQ